MIRMTDIRSLTEFQRSARRHIKHMKRTGRPVVLTVNGKAEVIVQDAVSYQRLMDAVERAQAIEGIQCGLESLTRGEGRSLDSFDREMRRKHDIRRKA